MEINCNPPTKIEIKKAIKALRGNEIPAEALKADIETSSPQIIWDEENVPPDWRDGNIIKIPKKGDLRECKNYRIMPLSTPGKVLNRIILERLQKAVDEKLRENQAGFRNRRSCGDQIATLRIIIKHSIEWNSPVLGHYGIPPKFISIIKNTYHGIQCQVLHEGCVSEAFEVLTGVRQVCLLSPFLFLLCIDWTMKQVTNNSRTGIQWSLTEQLQGLDFADDWHYLHTPTNRGRTNHTN